MRRGTSAKENKRRDYPREQRAGGLCISRVINISCIVSLIYARERGRSRRSRPVEFFPPFTLTM